MRRSCTSFIVTFVRPLLYIRLKKKKNVLLFKNICRYVHTINTNNYTLLFPGARTIFSTSAVRLDDL